jgi:hypothetical protein
LTQSAGAWPRAAVTLPRQRLDVELLDIKELVRRAFSTPMEAGVLLELRRGWWATGSLNLYTELPWLQQVPAAERVIKALMDVGWAILECGSQADAARVCACASKRVRLTRLGSEAR